MKKIDQSSKEEKNQKKRLTPRELVNKIIEDPNHIITNDDIKNLKTGPKAESKPERKKQSRNKLDELKSNSGDDKLINPYEVLDP